MPPILTKPSSAARTSLFFITVGALLTVWCLVWMTIKHLESDTSRFICFGLLASGIVLFIIGFGVGRIGREARHAELPPPEVTPAVAASAQRPAVVPTTQPVAGNPQAPPTVYQTGTSPPNV